jgi:hypothetical protein
MGPSSLLQRFATTDEVAAMVAFVASPLSSATNGAALRAEGGCRALVSLKTSLRPYQGLLCGHNRALDDS